MSIDEVIERIQNTMCETVGLRGGVPYSRMEGRISEADLHAFILAAKAPEREAVEQEPKAFNLESALDFLRAHNDGVYRIDASSKCNALVEWLLEYLQPYRIGGEHKKAIEATINEWLDSMGVNIGGKYNNDKVSRDFLARNIVMALSKLEEQPRRGTVHDK